MSHPPSPARRRIGLYLVVALALTFSLNSSALAQQAQPGAKGTAPAPARVASAHPFLWRIATNGAKPSHVFGTIHLPSKEVIKLPAAVEQAFAKADAVYCEIPFDAESLKQTASAGTGAARPLSRVLPQELSRRADAALKWMAPELGLKLFENAEVWVLATQLMVLEEQLKAPDTPFLDLLIYQSAQAARKEVGGIETVAEQLQAMNSLTAAEQLSMLQGALDQLDSARKRGQTAGAPLLAAYLTGRLDDLDACFRTMMQGYSPSLRKRFDEELLGMRNRRMAERIAAKLRATPDKSHFFALGAMHYAGQGSVLELLGKKGFKIERIQP